MAEKAFKVTFGEGSAIYVRADDHADARMRACLYAWRVCDYYPTVSAVEEIARMPEVIAHDNAA